MELEEYWDTDRDEADEQDSGAPLLPPTGDGDQSDATIPASISYSEARRGAAASLPDAPNDAMRSARAPGAGGLSRRDVVAPTMAAAARVSARLVSASGPVVDGSIGSRSSRRGTNSSSGLARRGVLPGAAATAAPREQRSSSSSSSSSNRRHRSRGAMEGEPQGGDRDIEEGKGEEDQPLAMLGGAGGTSFVEADDRGFSSQGSSDSDGDSSPNLVVTHPPPEEIRRALATSHNTIALLLLLMVHYVVTHIMGIACLVLGSAAIIGLDQRLRSHAGAQVLKSRFVLLGVATTAVLVVVLSAVVLNNFPEGDALLGGLVLITPKVDVGTLSAVISTTVVVDLWARFLSIAVKAILAVVPAVGSSTSDGSSRGHCGGACGGACGHLSCRRSFRGRFNGGVAAEGSARLRESPLPWDRGSSTFGPDAENSGGGGSDRRRGGSGGSRFSGGAQRAWRVWLCCSERCCGGPYRFGRHSASSGDGETEREEDRTARGTGILLSRAVRQRRVYAIVEMAFMLYRCMLPVPVWLEFYGKESDYFAAIYLVLKGVQVSFLTDRLLRAICYVRRGELDRGKFATPEEIAEGGSPDCSICYEEMVRPLILPCNHLFCGSCVAEWLERERTCPLCREVVPTTNPIPRTLRDGRTAILPQLL